MAAAAGGSGSGSGLRTFVRQHLCETLGLPELGDDAKLANLGLTSASSVQLQAAVTKYFRFQPSPTAWLDYPTLGALIGHYEEAYASVKAQPAVRTHVAYQSESEPQSFFPLWYRVRHGDYGMGLFDALPLLSSHGTHNLLESRLRSITNLNVMQVLYELAKVRLKSLVLAAVCLLESLRV